VDQYKDVNLTTVSNTEQKLAIRTLCVLFSSRWGTFAVAINPDFSDISLNLQTNRIKYFHTIFMLLKNIPYKRLKIGSLQE